MNFANAGIPVMILDLKEGALGDRLVIIRSNYEDAVREGRMTREQVEERMAMIEISLNYDDFQDADLVIEAVFERMDIKKNVFGKLDEVCKPDAILASTTSSLDIDEIASATKRPEAVIGLHFFSPNDVMKLLEIVRGEKTSDEVQVASMALAKRIKKVGVLVGNCRTSVRNRMLDKGSAEAVFLIGEGATPQQVEKVLTDLGFPAGQFAFDNIRSKRGVTPRKVTDQEVLERCLYVMVNEGAKIIDEGVVKGPLDIDIIGVYGCGFPAYRGGPLFWADRVGLDKVLEAVKKYHEDVGGRQWEASPLLKRLVAQSKNFGDAKS